MATDTSSWKRAQATAKRNIGRGRILVKLFYNRPVGRALRRYLEGNGNVLAGGVAYYSLVSIASALVLAVTVASMVVIGNDTLRDAVIDFVGNAIPGIFTTDTSAGLVDPNTLTPTPMSGLVGLIAFGVLIYTATRYMRGMRAATQTMLGKASAKVIPGTLSDVIALVGLGLVAILAAGFQIIAGSLAHFIAGLIGEDGGVSALSVRLVAIIAGLAANIGFVALVFLVLGSARAPARILVPTIVLTAFVIALLQAGSTYFVNSASHNSILAPFAAVIALLLFVDFTSRVMLIAAAWIGAASGAALDDHVHTTALPSPARRSRKSVTTRRAAGLQERAEQD